MGTTRFRFAAVFFLCAVQFLVSCGGKQKKEEGPGPQPSILHIAAAANLSYVMTELIGAFREEHSEYERSDIRVTKASSGNLVAQIRNSAPFDLFLSANTSYPQALYNDSLTAGSPVVYAGGVPVMVYRKGIDCRKGVKCLVDPSVEKIAVAQPELAPYGEAAIEILSRAGVLERVEGKFVYGASITQAFQHAVTAADAGFVAKSLLYGDAGKELEKAGMAWVGFAPDSYNPAALRQAMVLLDASNGEAKAFFRFMQGERAGEILKNNGYRVE
jgi:molybdate transport system substrate-binding protein